LHKEEHSITSVKSHAVKTLEYSLHDGAATKKPVGLNFSKKEVKKVHAQQQRALQQ